MKKLSLVLQEARAKIENKKHWCTGTFAKDKRGRKTYPKHPQAYKFCAIGALGGFDANPSQYDSQYLLDALAFKEHAGRTAPQVNDELGHKAVLDLYDLAISAAMSDEAK